jgi:glycerophosphoryl diester phosphodiesterase
MKQPVYLEHKSNTKIIAHRGLSGIERENTLLSFVAAGNRSYYGMECDVHVTKDEKYIICHDDSTNRVCGKNLILEESIFAELRALPLKESGSETLTDSIKLPTLQEYLSVCERYGKVAIIELKNQMAPKHIQKIVSICKDLYDLNSVVFISFCFENLVEVRKCSPNQTVQFLTCEYTDEIFHRLCTHKFDIDIEYRCLTKENIAQLHTAGILVNCWTCDEKSSAEQLIAWGVDYITSNILE